MLKPRYREEEPKTMLQNMKRDCFRGNEILKDLEKTLPENINIEYSFNYDDDKINIHLQPEEMRYTAKETRALLVWATSNYKKPNRSHLSDSGEIYYHFQSKEKTDRFGTYTIEFYIDHSHPLSCQIVPVKKEVTVYEAVCSEDA